MIQCAQNKALRIINFKKFTEPSEPLYNQLKINSLKNKIILNNCLFVFDELANNLPDAFHQFSKPFKELRINAIPGSHNSVYLIFLKLIHKCLVLIQQKLYKSMNDWNKMLHKIQFSYELLLKCNEFIKLVKNIFVT